MDRTHLASTLGPLITDATFDLAFRARLPVPTNPTRLLVLLHGVGGNESSLAALVEEFDPETLVVLPRGPLEFAPGQYGWFQVSFASTGPVIEASQADASRQRLIRFVQQLQATHRIAPQRSVIAGFSQGGILSASVALTAPERVAGFGVLAGRILPELEPYLASRERLANLHGFIGHGQHDSKLPVVWAERASRWLDALGVTRSTRLYPTDHELSAPMRADFLHWFSDTTARYDPIRLAQTPEE